MIDLKPMPAVHQQLAVMEGSMGIAKAVAASRPDVISAYPITPQTHIVEFLAQMVSDGDLDCEYIQVDSEFSAASVIAGASAAGVRAYTASSSQGLMLMTEVLFYLAGARMPVVITAANRQVTAPVGLQPDHQDSMTFRDAGMIQLYCETAQEAYDTHIQAFKIAEDHDILLPVMVCVDGYILTHVFEPISTLTQEAVDGFLPRYEPLYLVTPENPMTFGAISDDTNNLEFRIMHEQAMERARGKIEQIAREFEAAFGRYNGGLIETYLADDAEIVLVAMGSTCSTLRDAIDTLRAEGVRVGLLKIRSYRPFPAEEIRAALANAKVAVVLDRAMSVGFMGIVGAEVQAALYGMERGPLVLSKLAGFGGREVTLETVRKFVADARAALSAGSAGATTEFVGLRPHLLPAESQR